MRNRLRRGKRLTVGAAAFAPGEQVSHVKPRGNSARFNNLSLYIRRECLTTWKDDGSDQTTVYVNVYEAGKCSVLAAPDADVAEELADVVCNMLLDALQHEHIRINVDCTTLPPGKKQCVASRASP